MANSVLIGQYRETYSILHRLDPRTKILAIILLMVSLLMLDSFFSYTMATIFVLSIMLLSRIPLLFFVKGMKPIFFILLFTFIYHAAFTSGNVIWSWSFIHITVEGLQNGARYVWRILLLVLLASILTLTTKPLTLADGLVKLLSPLSKFNIPVEQFALMIVIAIRFIPTILQELDRILLAQKARGHDINDLPLHKRIFAYIPTLIPLLFTIIQRAEQLTFAIDARAYGNGKGRTSYKLLKFQPLDYLVVLIVLLIMAILLFV